MDVLYLRRSSSWREPSHGVAVMTREKESRLTDVPWGLKNPENATVAEG